MKFHGIDMRGKFIVQRVATIPTFVSTDKGRLIYVEDEDEFYFGGTTEWKKGGEANADKVDGYHASQTANPNTIPVADASGKLASDWLPPMEAATVGGYTPSVTPGASKIPVADGAGKLDANWLPALNADTVDGFHAQKTAAADRIPVAGADGKLDIGWFPSALQGGAGFAAYTTPGSYNFTVPEDVTKIYAEVQGAGGGGCVYNNSRSAGSAGGSSSVGALLSAGGGGGGASKNVSPSAGSVSGANITKPRLFTSAGGGLNAIAGTGGDSPYGNGGAGYSNSNTAGSGGNGGAGAGGGGANKDGTTVCDAPGGAAGGFGCGVYDVTPGSTITITVGSRGAGGNISSWRGGTGGNGFVKLWWW